MIAELAYQSFHRPRSVEQQLISYKHWQIIETIALHRPWSVWASVHSRLKVNRASTDTGSEEG